MSTQESPSKFSRLTSLLERMTDLILVVIVLALTGIIVLQVIFRYGLNNALVWPEAIGLVLLVWLTFLGTSSAYFKKDHVSIDLIIEKLPARVEKTIRLLNDLIILLVALFLIGYGSLMTLDQVGFTMRVLDVSLVWTRLPIPIGGFLIFVASVDKIIKQYYS